MLYFHIGHFLFLKSSRYLNKLIFINVIICGELILKEGPSHQLLGL